MSIYLDSASPAECRNAWTYGFLKGVTTNPGIVAATGRHRHDLVGEILGVTTGAVFVQIAAGAVEGMTEEARSLISLSESRVVIKVPCCEAGLRFVDAFRYEGAPTCMTGIGAARQAYLAAASGASYTAVFVGRIDRAGGSGIDVVRRASEIFQTHALPARVLAASISEAEEVETLLPMRRVDVTIPYSLIGKLLDHPVTADALGRFEEAQKKGEST